jgi:hypothetical protein
MNKSEKKINEKSVPMVNPAKVKLLPYDDISKKKTVK